MTNPESELTRTAGAAIGMSNAAAAGRIEEDYASSGRYQHAIEISRNAMQLAGTTDITLDIVAWPTTGALKRMIRNNGPHMPKADMEQYMTTIGEGAGDLWRLHNTLGNRHAGARTSVLPFTDLGILSWDRNLAPHGLYMKLYKDPVAQDYRYTPVTTPSASLLGLLTRQRDVARSGHGVAFFYLGRDERLDGPFVDPNPLKGETDNGLTDAMRDRFFDLTGADGTPITVTVNTPMPANAGAVGGRKLTGADGTHYRLDGRVLKGHSDWVRQPCESGSVEVDPALGINIHYTLLPHSMDPANRRLPFGGKGHIVIRYKNESMVLAAPGGDYPDLPKLMRLFGVQLADVYNRLSLVIEGPTDPGHDPANARLHLHQDPSRSSVILSNGQKLPLDEWGAAFINNMPPAIVLANKEARERIGNGAAIRLSTGDRLRARLESRLRLSIPSRRRKAGSGIPGPSGLPGMDYLDGMLSTGEHLPAGTPSASGVEGLTAGGSTSRKSKPTKKGAKRRSAVAPTGPSTTRKLQAGSEASTDVQPRPAPIPQPVPTPSDKWAEQFDPDDFASWSVAEGCVYFNLGHPIYQTQVAYFTGEWLDRHQSYRLKVTSEDVRGAVHAAYEEDTIGRILHYVAAVGVAQAKLDLTDRNLTIAAHGFENVQDKIESLVRTAAGRGVVAPGAAA